MNDKELLNSLNESSKQFIDDLLSFYSYLLDKKSPIINIDNIVGISLFLSMLKNDEISSRFFNKYGINYNNFKDIFKTINFNDIEFQKAENSSILPDINLKALLSKVLIKVTYTCYLEQEKLSYSKLTAFQIYDALIENEQMDLFLLLKNHYNNIKENIFDEYDKYIHDAHNDFSILYYGINIDEEVKKEIDNFKVYNFDDCTIELSGEKSYITFNKNADLEKIIWHINKEFKEYSAYDKNVQERKKEFISNIELPITFEIERIDNYPNINKDVIESLLNNKKRRKIPFELKNLSNNKKIIVWIDKYVAFTPYNQQIVDEIIKGQELPNNEIIDEDIKIYTPYLDKYGVDLTKNKYIKDPSVGREDEIRRIEQILCYPERDKSIIITGVSGCGKTALVNGLAYRIQKGEVPNVLKKIRIIDISAAKLVAGTKYVGTLEEKMDGILEEASKSKDIVIFMDEIHQALGAGKSEGDSNTVSEILKPYLGHGKVRLIGATTTKEYNEIVSNDDAFRTRFKRVNINEPDDSIVYQILDDLIENYNNLYEKHNILCPKLNLNDEERDKVIKWLIDSTSDDHRPYNDKCSNPRLVLDIIKEAYAIATLNNQDEVTITNLKEALFLEERLNLSSRKMQIEKLDSFKINNPKDNVIPFSLIYKKD